MESQPAVARSIPRPRLRRFAIGALSAAVGLFAALGAGELGLRALVSPALPPLPAIDRDLPGAPIVESRQIEEGIATAHFSAAGARLTGNPVLPNAPTAVIIGDSYVVAREVRDSETMGAVLERMARSEGVALNARQYGWRGATPAQYIDVAPAVLARWNPAAIIVPLSDDDLDERAIAGQYPRLRIDAKGDARVVRDPSGPPGPPTLPRSVLAAHARFRWQQIVARAPRRVRDVLNPPAQPAVAPPVAFAEAPAETTQPLDAIPLAAVRALKNAYGARLLILYVADVRVAGGDRPDSLETRLLDACSAEGVVCASARDAMLDARRSGTIVRGFSTTTLGVGHLNPAGHQLVAKEIWRLLRPRLSPSGVQ